MSDESPVTVFGTLATAKSSAEIAALFPQSAWRLRKSGWDEFELIAESADLYVESKDPVLIHGAVASEAVVHVILGVLDNADIAYEMEWYSQSNELLGKRVR